ncbi:MAG: hypothetical protein V1802_03610 [Candidatus Aenigmatarchaeota archaeon]
MQNYQGNALYEQEKEEQRKKIRRHAAGCGALLILTAVAFLVPRPKEYKGEWMEYTVPPSVVDASREDTTGIYHIYGVPIRRVAETIVKDMKYTKDKKTANSLVDAIADNPVNAYKDFIYPSETIEIPDTTDVRKQ